MAKNDPKISYSYAFCYVEFTKSRQRYKKIFIYARERECIREFYTKCVNFYTLEKGAKRNSIQVKTRLKVGNDQHKSTFGKKLGQQKFVVTSVLPTRSRVPPNLRSHSCANNKLLHKKHQICEHF